MVMLSPGVYTKEKDFSSVVAGISPAIAGFVGVFKKGPIMERTLVTSGADFERKFGEPFPSSMASYSAMQFLQQGNMLWIVRTCGGVGANPNTPAEWEAEFAEVSVQHDTTPTEGEFAITFTADSAGTWADEGDLSVKISNVADSAFQVTVFFRGEVVEEYFDVDVDVDSEDYIEKVMEKSRFVHATDLIPGDWDTKMPAEGTYPLTGGTNGIDVSTTPVLAGVESGDFIAAMNEFQNPDDVYVNLLAVPGNSDDAVVAKGLEICETRADCLYLVDPPQKYSEQDVVEWHNGIRTGDDVQAFNSSYGALYWPWAYIYDPYSRGNIRVPPSGLVAGAMAYNDREGEPWFAPAGMSRGRLLTPIRLEANPSLGSRDFMYSQGNAVNPIVNFPVDGITIWGQRTLQRKPSATDRVNVRRLMLLVRRAVAISTNYLVFEQNDFQTWDRWKNMVEPFLDNIRQRRGLDDFMVIMDETTVTPYDIDSNRMPGKILLKPTRAAEFISIDFVIYPTGVSFTS